MGSEVKREDLWKTPSITRVASETDSPLFFVKHFLECLIPCCGASSLDRRVPFPQNSPRQHS